MPYTVNFTLAQLALIRTCKDILRHSRKWEAEINDETSNYWKFRMLFSEEVLKLIASKLEELHFSDVSQLSSRRYGRRRFLDFILNPYVRDLSLPPGGYSNTVMSAIVRNCKDLEFFAMDSVALTPDVCVPIFKNLEKLVQLNLKQCRSLDIRTIEVIADSLIHLQVLSFEKTDICDDGIFKLCGHRTDKPLIPSCCFSNQCKAQAPPKLRQVCLEGTSVSNLGIACILTHIQTITCIRPHYTARFSVPDAICLINMYRRMSKMVDLNFDLKRLSCPESFKNWDTLFSACSKVKVIELYVKNDKSCYDNARDQGLAQLKYLFGICVRYEQMRSLFTDNFQHFWRMRGKQLQLFGLSSIPYSYAEYDPSILRKILSMCSSVEMLILRGLTVRGNTERQVSGDFPYLGNLCLLALELLGDSKVVKTELFKIISAARKTRKMVLDVPVEDKTIFDFIEQEQFPDLEKLYIKRDNRFSCYLYLPVSREGGDGIVRRLFLL